MSGRVQGLEQTKRRGKGAHNPFSMQAQRIARPRACIGRCLHLDHALTLQPPCPARPSPCTAVLFEVTVASNGRHLRATQRGGTDSGTFVQAQVGAARPLPPTLPRLPLTQNTGADKVGTELHGWGAGGAPAGYLAVRDDLPEYTIRLAAMTGRVPMMFVPAIIIFQHNQMTACKLGRTRNGHNTWPIWPPFSAGKSLSTRHQYNMSLT